MSKSVTKDDIQNALKRLKAHFNLKADGNYVISALIIYLEANINNIYEDFGLEREDDRGGGCGCGYCDY